MEQQKSLNALYPFLTLSKSASSPRQAADIVSQATSASNVFIFAELLSTPAIQSLRSDAQFAPHYRLLEIFTWGTWTDYTCTLPPLPVPYPSPNQLANLHKAASQSLPPLSPAQTHKLKLLSLLTLASTASSSSDLTYANLTPALGLTTPKELEDLVTDAIYADLMQATLDPARGVVIVAAVAPLRDLAPGSVGDMIRELEAWAGRCEGVLAEMEGRVEGVKGEARRKGEWDALVEGQRERAEGKWGANVGAGGEGQGFGKGDAMDVDSVAVGGGGGGGGKRRWFGGRGKRD
ncbi:COP9 signalosome complex subunit 7 [Elsinoe australis]|uniref:COP9 signalosome complex subunit 7 n=1 Tax=Elsinoe australis TaxID=40998 RepID=A0A2P8A012_9PEZI|nr:COP9 signalosome complex subunit 7 [Elsinoe australis]